MLRVPVVVTITRAVRSNERLLGHFMKVVAVRIVMVMPMRTHKRRNSVEYQQKGSNGFVSKHRKNSAQRRVRSDRSELCPRSLRSQ